MYLTVEDIQLMLLTVLNNTSQIVMPQPEDLWTYPEAEPVEDIQVAQPQIVSLTMGKRQFRISR